MKPPTVKHEGPTLEQLSELEKELERTGVDIGSVLERYRIKEVSEMTGTIYKNAMASLKRTKAKTAA